MDNTTNYFPLNETTNIPAIGYGTYLITDEAAAEAVHTAIEIGYRHIDTAAGYHNENGVGEGVHRASKSLELSRNEIFVTTKLWPGNPAWGDQPKSYADALTAAEESLSKLGLDYVDLYLIHAPFGGSERLNEWRALIDFQKAGKARSIGVSNFTVKHLEEIRLAGLQMPDANQIELHPWSQKPELIAYMRTHNISPIAYSSLAPASTWRKEPGQDSAKTDDMRNVDVFIKLAEKYGVSEAQFLLKWGVQNGYAVLPKSMNENRMAQNLDLFGFEISKSDMDDIQSMDRGEAIAWASGDPSIAR